MPKSFRRAARAISFAIARPSAARCAFRLTNSPAWPAASRRPPNRRSPSNGICSTSLAREALGRRQRLCRISPTRSRCSTCRFGVGRARGRQSAMRAPRSTIASPSQSRADAIRWSKQRSIAAQCRPFVPNDCDLSRDGGAEVVAGHRPQHGGQIDLPAPERADRDPGADGKLRARRAAPISASSTGCSAASARATIWRAGAPPSWSRWWRPPRSSIRRPTRASSSSTRSAAAPRPSTASPSPGRRAEHLAIKNKSRALFATHYHEMTALAERLESLACVTMRVKEWNDTIVFLHEVVPGVADRSYGIHVAKLAGLPAPVVARARRSAARAGGRPRRPQAASPHRRSAAVLGGAPEETSERWRKPYAPPPDALTPKAALELVYALKEILSAKK